MASIQDYGIRIFSVDLDTSSYATIVQSHEELEDKVNTFLEGQGTVDEPLKELIDSPQFTVDETNNVLYVVIKFRRALT